MTTESSSVGTDLSTAGTDLAERLLRSLVSIRSQAGGGAGTAWASDGLIITNHHVVPESGAEVLLPGNRSIEGRVVARDESNDLAMLRVDAELVPAEVGDSRALRAGSLVFAVGNPWGQRGLLTRGVVFATGATTFETPTPIRDVIRADIRLAPGNSGGPLADAHGRVVGINSMIAGGMGVAIPAHTIESFIANAVPGEPGILGVTIQAVPIPHAIAASFSLDAEGLMLTGIEPGSPAEQAGLIPGDLLVGIGTDSPRDARKLAGQLRAMRAGSPVDLSLLRGGQLVHMRATPVVRA